MSRTAIKYLFGEGVQPLAYVRLKTEVKRDIQLDLAVDAFLLSNGAPVSVADVLARYNRPTPAAGEPLLRPPGSAGGGMGGGVKGAASEDATLASIERAANAVAAGNFHSNHDKLGRFASSDEPSAGDAPSSKNPPLSRSTDDEQNLFYHPEDILGLSKPHEKVNISPAWSGFLKFIKGVVSPRGPFFAALGTPGSDEQIQGMQDLLDQGAAGMTEIARAEGGPAAEKKMVQGLKDQVTTPGG